MKPLIDKNLNYFVILSIFPIIRILFIKWKIKIITKAVQFIVDISRNYTKTD